MNIETLSFISLFAIIAIVGIWNNWVIIGKNGYMLCPHPSFWRWSQMAIINLFRIITFEKVIKFSDLPEYNKENVIGYIVDDGDTFHGTVQQFKCCFFSNADEETVRAWCDDNGSKLKVIYEGEGDALLL